MGAGTLGRPPINEEQNRMYEEPAIIASFDAATLLGDAHGTVVENGSTMSLESPILIH